MAHSASFERAVAYAHSEACMTGYRYRVYKSVVVGRWCVVQLARPSVIPKIKNERGKA